MSQTPIKIDQALQVALQAGVKNNIFIYHAPQANVESINVPEKYEGVTQMLYAVCAELLAKKISLKDWSRLSRTAMLQAAVDKYPTKTAAAEALGLSEIKDMRQLESVNESFKS